MRKTVFIGFLLSLILFSCDANFADLAGLGGKGGPPVYSISDASDARDGTPAVLEGKLGKYIFDEKWNFSDTTGSIPVELDFDGWWGPNAPKEGDEVVVYGEVEKEMWERTYIDVDRITKK
jgi:uncharacterized protein (TIGR00156 family)